MGRILSIIEYIVFSILLAILCWMIYSIHVNKSISFLDYHFLRIISNSMEPTFKVNTCIVVKKVPETELQIGDIITFYSKETEIYGNYNTHRIYDIVLDESTGENRYITKGDLFEYPDRLKQKYSDIVGKYYKTVPHSDKISFVVEKLSNNKIYFFVLIFPLILCLLSYIYQLIQLIMFGVEDDNQNKVNGIK